MNPILLFWPLVLCCLTLRAEIIHKLPAPDQELTSLVIYGAADYPAIAPFFHAFQQRYPVVRIEYREFATRDLYEQLLARYPQMPDLVLSSAMDLQVKLVNDGFAQPHRSPATIALPEWARWRDEVFGFTYEPAVIAMNRNFLAEEKLPKNRAELLELIRRKEDQVRGRIGTFDIARVGVGYLTWSYDRQQSAAYGRMLESFGANQARLFPSSASMLQALAQGEIVIAYNLLGSYAHDWAKRHPHISIILPSDYTALVMRTVFIPKNASNVEGAKVLLDFLLSREGQQVLAQHSSLYPIRENVVGETTASGLRARAGGLLRPIPLGPSLLIQTDQASRRRLLEEWERAMQRTLNE